MSLDPRELDPLVDEAPSRFVVGIDLGTTNSAMAYVDTQETPWRVRVFPIPQLVGPAQVESLETLPSFHYHAAAGETESGVLRLPWSRRHADYAVGVFARDEGTKTPGRIIASAKSWLSHSGVDRTAELLPWQGATDVERLSPVEVSARYLRHMRDAWNARFPADPLAEQDILLTLPASFDEVARELTVQAAAKADLPRVVLIEEPLAAFYAWIDRHSQDWQQLVAPGQKILICDIGGGTTDFTLVRVRRTGDASQGDEIQFHRVAVGDHLILGGDNLDLALARHLERRIAGDGQLAPQQWDVLVRLCRRVKETLLGDSAPPRLTVNLPSAGARLIGGGIQVEVTREEVQQLLVEGFLPRVELTDRPARRQSGFQEFGLPYAADPAVTRYLAAFLTAHREVALEDLPPLDHDPARPDVVLLNGGFFEAPILRERLLDVVSDWFSGSPERPWRPQVLENQRLDLAVAQGAAYYGMVRRGEGVRVAANLARSYYVGIDSPEPTAVCLVPGNADTGTAVRNERPHVRIDRLGTRRVPALRFQRASGRSPRRPGARRSRSDDRSARHPHGPQDATAQRTREPSKWNSTRGSPRSEPWTSGAAPAQDDRRWRLQFDVRSATQTDRLATATEGEQAGFIDEGTWQECERLIANVFGEGR